MIEPQLMTTANIVIPAITVGAYNPRYAVTTQPATKWHAAYTAFV